MAFIEIKDDVYINVDNIESFNGFNSGDTPGDIHTVLRTLNGNEYVTSIPPYRIARMIRSCGCQVEELHSY